MVTSRGTWSERRGWLLRLQAADGRLGWGEAALAPVATPAAGAPGPDQAEPRRDAASQAGRDGGAMQAGRARETGPRQAAGPAHPAGPARHARDEQAKAAAQAELVQAALAALPPALEREALERLLPGLPLPLACALGMALAELDGLGSPEQGGWLAAPASALLLPAGEAAIPALERALAQERAADPQQRRDAQSLAASPGTAAFWATATASSTAGSGRTADFSGSKGSQGRAVDGSAAALEGLATAQNTAALQNATALHSTAASWSTAAARSSAGSPSSAASWDTAPSLKSADLQHTAGDAGAGASGTTGSAWAAKAAAVAGSATPTSSPEAVIRPPSGDDATAAGNRSSASHGAICGESQGAIAPAGPTPAPGSAAAHRERPGGAGADPTCSTATRPPAGGSRASCFTVKWKVAALDDALERQVLEALLARLPASARLRLDANGGWDRATAGRWATRLKAEPRLEWLEQPLPPDDRQGLEQLAAQLPLALDESLRSDPALCAGGWTGWQVRRPLAEGDPRPLLAALQAGRPRLMLSTALETGLGRRLLHHLAALQRLGPTPTAPGLAPGWCPDGELFADDPQAVWEAAR